MKNFDLHVNAEIEQLKALKRPYAASVYSAATVNSQHTESRSVITQQQSSSEMQTCSAETQIKQSLVDVGMVRRVW